MEDRELTGPPIVGRVPVGRIPASLGDDEPPRGQTFSKLMANSEHKVLVNWVTNTLVNAAQALKVAQRRCGTGPDGQDDGNVGPPPSPGCYCQRQPQDRHRTAACRAALPAGVAGSGDARPEEGHHRAPGGAEVRHGEPVWG